MEKYQKPAFNVDNLLARIGKMTNDKRKPCFDLFWHFIEKLVSERTFTDNEERYILFPWISPLSLLLPHPETPYFSELQPLRLQGAV
jgi:hypothetical protein